MSRPVDPHIPTSMHTHTHAVTICHSALTSKQFLCAVLKVLLFLYWNLLPLIGGEEEKSTLAGTMGNAKLANATMAEVGWRENERAAPEMRGRVKFNKLIIPRNSITCVHGYCTMKYERKKKRSNNLYILVVSPNEYLPSIFPSENAVAIFESVDQWCATQVSSFDFD